MSGNPGLHYSTVAIEAFRKDRVEMTRAYNGQAGRSSIGRDLLKLNIEMVELMAELLMQAEKFQMPPAGQLMERGSLPEIDAAFFLRLPYPIVALEYPCECDLPVTKFTTDRSSKRIALAAELTPGLIDRLVGMGFIASSVSEAVVRQPAALASATRTILMDMGRKAFAIFSVSWFDGSNVWEPAIGAVCAGPSTSIARVTAQVEAPELVAMGLSSPGATNRLDGVSLFHPVAMSVECDVRGWSAEDGIMQIRRNLGDEVWTTLQLLMVLNCSNIECPVTRGPKFINEKRRKKGLPPLFDYRVLTVTGEVSVAGPADGAGGHASPRLHWRRGHIRRLATGTDTPRMVWVRAAVVGSAALGSIDKHYRVQPAAYERRQSERP